MKAAVGRQPRPSRAESVDLTLPVAWGAPVTQDQVQQAEAANLQRARHARQDVVEHSVSRAAAAWLLGLSERAVTRRIEQGQMVGFKIGRRWAVPSWQLDTGRRELIPAVKMVRARFPGGPLDLSRWTIRPSPDLAGRSPREMLVSRRVAEVLRGASTLTGLQ